MKLTEYDKEYIKSIRESDLEESKKRRLIELVEGNRAVIDLIFNRLDLKPNSKKSSKSNKCFTATLEASPKSYSCQNKRCYWNVNSVCNEKGRFKDCSHKQE